MQTFEKAISSKPTLSRATVITSSCRDHLKLRPKLLNLTRYAHCSNSFTMGEGHDEYAILAHCIGLLLLWIVPAKSTAPGTQGELA
jgi:hypothetical protein